MAALIVRLAQDAVLAAALGANGRAAVRADYSWDTAADAVRMALIDLVATLSLP
jgi:glycosyltransferase involved in cell wall biosynthesis